MSKKPSAVVAMSVREFFARFPNDDACLVHIMNVRFGGTTMDCPSCGSVGVEFHKLRDRRVYACGECLFQIAPTANTILHDTRTPLVSWFYAMYLFATTRHGVSGKELQRQLGVTYKTAYRIGLQIRTLIGKADFDGLLTGHIEADEAYVGGRRSGGKRGRGAPGKTIVMGIKQRDGALITAVIPDLKKPTLRAVVNENVEKGSVVSTDELYSYGLLEGDGYVHGSVQHGRKEYAPL
jgi:transposase